MNLGRFNRFLKYCASAIRKVGGVTTCEWIFSTAQLNLNIATPRFVNLRPPFLKHGVKLRAMTSDPFVFRQIMIEDEYLPLAGLRITTVLDLGANIGLASAWFLSRFPEASVYAVEAEADNYATCCENLAAYGSQARVLHGAAWSQRSTLSLRRNSCAANNSVHESGDRPREMREAQVQAWDLASLIEMSGFAHVDLLKIDIEGAETAIFGTDVSNWLPRVSALCIELHGEACRHSFFQALAGYDFDHVRSGELDICTNLRPKMNPSI